MLDVEEEIAISIWSAQTGNNSPQWWRERTSDGEKDQYRRAAKMVVRRLLELGFRELNPANT